MNILHLSDIHFGRNYARYSIKDCFDLKSEILDELIKCVSKLNQFWLISKQHFYCKLFGKEIDLGERVMLLGKYKLDAADINYKIETYKSGDTRKVSFRACDETQRVTMIYWSEEELDFHDSDNYVVIRQHRRSGFHRGNPENPTIF